MHVRAIRTPLRLAPPQLPRIVSNAALATALVLGTAAAAGAGAVPAHAQTLDDLAYGYQAAVGIYEDALQAQTSNQERIEEVEGQVATLEDQIAEEQENLEESTVAFYKNFPGRGKMIDMLLDCDSLDQAIACFDSYERIERAYLQSVRDLQSKRNELTQLQEDLGEQKHILAGNVAEALDGVLAAQAAYADADHSDGIYFHQKQGASNNCGATAFTVGVNILLHENRYPDNVAVWSGAGFGGDSTANLAAKASIWLAVNGLSDQIRADSVPGDIHSAGELRAELEQGHVVVISSGAGSVWRYADGSALPGLFPDGHWIVFYYYADGTFYANDSSVGATRGAGCPYSEADLQQWLNGRSNHFAVSLSKAGA